MALTLSLTFAALIAALFLLNGCRCFTGRAYGRTVDRILYVAAGVLFIALLLFEGAGMSIGLRERFHIIGDLASDARVRSVRVASAGLLFALSLCGVLRLKRERGDWRRSAAVIVLIAVALECTLYNYKCFDSLSFSEVTGYSASYSDAFVPADDTDYDLSEGGAAYRLDAERGDAVITLKNIDDAVENLYFDADNRMASVSITVSGSDEGTDAHGAFPEKKILDTSESSRYIRLHMSGKTRELTIRIIPKTQYEDDILIREIGLNRPVPFTVSFLRMALTVLLLSLVWAVRPASPLYAVVLNVGDKRQRRLIIGVTACLVLLFAALTQVNSYSDNAHRNQYGELAKAFERGQLSFLYEPPQELIEMENPYDSSARRAITHETGVYFHYDHAYYNGKYYMYFGVVPEVLLFLPYRLLTGRTLPTSVGVAVCISALCTGLMLLICRIARKFKKPRLLTVLLIGSAACIGLSVIFAKYPSLYSVPISAAAALTAFGLYFWISAREALKRGRLAAGSLCIALIFGCRPQAGIVFLLAIPLFWREVFHRRTLFSRAGAVDTLCLMLPFVPVALALMWYNAARFGSPFDFGANYNLTTNDMTLRGFVLARLPAGLYSLLLQLPAYTLKFPFLESLSMVTGYQGKTISEAMFGGVYATYPVLLLAPGMFVYRKQLKGAGLYGFCLLLLCLPFIVACVDIEMAGVLHRYTGDYMLMLFLLSAIVGFTVDDTETGRGISWFHALLSAGFLAGLCFAFCFLFAFDANGLSYQISAPRFFDTVSQFIMFWN